MRILTSSQMQAADRHAIDEIGIPSIVLMENACRAFSRLFKQRFPKERFTEIRIVAGKGNNGGDGIGIARILAEFGYSVKLILLAPPDQLKADPKINFQIYAGLGNEYLVVSDAANLEQELQQLPVNNGVIIDAIFGTGLDKPLKPGFYRNIIRAINCSGLPVASVDIPSGLSDLIDLDSNNVIHADFTVTFQSLKTSHLYPDGNPFCGDIYIADIGIPQTSIQQSGAGLFMSECHDFDFLNIPRKSDGHKGEFGHCLNISGSEDKPGAAVLSSVAMLRSGAGLCTVASSEINRNIVINQCPELMLKFYKDPSGLLELIVKADSLLLGPGLGINDQNAELLSAVLENAIGPVVVDADGLTLLAERLELLKTRENRVTVLTPHLGEFSRLSGETVANIKKNRIPLARKFASKFQVFLVLKGHHTLIVSPNGDVFVNQTGNPGMATAGSGDVLSGIITGFIGQYRQNRDMLSIISAAVFLHGYAGDIAKGIKGEMALVASDIIHQFPAAFQKINDYQSEFKLI